MINLLAFLSKNAKVRVVKILPFSGRILVIGAGGVGQCTLPLLLKHIDMPRDRITVMDMLDKRTELADSLEQGVKFVHEEIKKETYEQQLGAYVGAGDMIIDLAWNIGCTDIVQWCHDNDVLYINTSVEMWDPSYTPETPMTDRTLYVRHMAIRNMIVGWKNKGATAILEHGANPGLVSHFTKMGLIDIGQKVLDTVPANARTERIQQALTDRQYAALASELGVKVIHISEIDSQVTRGHRAADEFVNTWSVQGFHEEGIAPAEMGWGTHEQTLPAGSHSHTGGPENQICLDSFGINTFVKTTVPSADTIGMVVRHGEAFTISDSLTVWDGPKALYRPTVHYAYRCCDEGLDSLAALRKHNYELFAKERIMSNDILPGGQDELGCLMMGHDFKSWWVGTILTIDEAREILPGQNATTLQVAGSVIGAVLWMIEHPTEGVRVPDQLPHEPIMEVALPYLGKVPSIALDWAPVELPENYSHEDVGPWQFQNFVIDPAQVSEKLTYKNL